MNKKYYFKNIAISLGLLTIGLFVWFYKEPTEETVNHFYLFIAIISAMLFPISKKNIEKFFLHFTTESFWTTGLLTENSGKNGLYVMYYIICMAIAIPLTCGLIIYIAIKKWPIQTTKK